MLTGHIKVVREMILYWICLILPTSVDFSLVCKHYSQLCSEKGSLQSLDWNGGITNSPKNKVKRSPYCALLVSEGIRIIQIDSSLTNYTQKRYEMITCLDKMLSDHHFWTSMAIFKGHPLGSPSQMAWLWSAIKIVMLELEILWGSHNFLASTVTLWGHTHDDAHWYAQKSHGTLIISYLLWSSIYITSCDSSLSVLS